MVPSFFNFEGFTKAAPVDLYVVFQYYCIVSIYCNANSHSFNPPKGVHHLTLMLDILTCS